jgi:hypothetical protein
MIGGQYATGLSRQSIEKALVAAGKDLDHLSPADLGPLEDFHTMGRIATGQAAALMRAVLARPAEPLGLHAFVPDFAAKAGNLTAALASGRLRAIQAIAVAA